MNHWRFHWLHTQKQMLRQKEREEKVLLQHVTSGNALMVQFNSRVITGVTVVKGRAGSSLSRGWGGTAAVIQRWWRDLEDRGSRRSKCTSGGGGGEGVCWDNSGDGGTVGAGEELIPAAECPPLLRSRLAGLHADVLQRTEGGIGEEFHNLQRYLSIFTRSCYRPTALLLLLLPSLSWSLWSHLKCHSIDVVGTKHTQTCSESVVFVFLSVFLRQLNMYYKSSYCKMFMSCK